MSLPITCSRGRRLAATLAGAAAVVLAAPAIEAAQAGCPQDCSPKTFLLSQTPAGDIPNGPSKNSTISHDDRIASVVGFESLASDLVPGDVNGKSDVFVVHRRTPYNGTNGTEWNLGPTALLSRGLNGRPANGPSYKPAASGAVDATPKCIAFVSQASNLVPGDTNGRADAFVANVRDRSIRRVSVSSTGRQSNGHTYDVTVNGTCDRVAFTSDASNLALTRTGRANWAPMRTSAPPRGSRQVYVRQIAGGGEGGRLDDIKGVTFVASARSGRPGNGNSYDPVLPSRAGDSVAFTSRATNLAAGDSNAREDVLWRTMALKSERSGRTLRGDTKLVSRTRSGRAGNGRSRNPAISGATQYTSQGQFITYETDATDIARNKRDVNKTTDVVRTKFFRGVVSSMYASNGQNVPETGNGPAAKPSITEAGTFIFHDTKASNYRKHPSAYKNDGNGTISDVFLWTQTREGAILAVWDNELRPLSMDSHSSATSARGNYYTFETRDPFTDSVLAKRNGWYAQRQEMQARAAQEDRFSQVYMRYGGPQ